MTLMAPNEFLPLRWPRWTASSTICCAILQTWDSEFVNYQPLYGPHFSRPCTTCHWLLSHLGVSRSSLRLNQVYWCLMRHGCDCLCSTPAPGPDGTGNYGAGSTRDPPLERECLFPWLSMCRRVGRKQTMNKSNSNIFFLWNALQCRGRSRFSSNPSARNWRQT